LVFIGIRSGVLADDATAFRRLLPVVFPLLVAPSGTFLGIELAIVIGVDLVEALAVELIALLSRHRRNLIVIRLAPLNAGLLGRGKAGRCQLPHEPCLALL
jgi:hypothetical protein